MIKNKVNKIYHRPWGFYQTLLITKTYQVKMITINPHEALSLQKHHHRREHWTIVQGNPTIIVNDLKKNCQVGETIFIDKKSLHRAENHQEEPTIIIEIQLGDYLGEDDITRIEDKYGRIS